MNMEDGKDCIIPVRYIPFDIGIKIDESNKEAIKKALLKDYKKIEPNKMLMNLLDDLILAFKINERIKLYVYKFGIGVFLIQDEEYHIADKAKFAKEYCKSRKEAHKQYLNFTYKYSEELKKIIRLLRDVVQNNTNRKIRPSASESWENKGLSYVFTASFIQSGNLEVKFDNMPDQEKRNLCIMMEPSIANEGDSMVVSISNEENNLHDFCINDIDRPKCWIKDSNVGFYISWAAVVIYMQKINKEYFEFVESLEVSLQAMWLYVYCLYYDMKNKSSKKRKVSDLKRELFKFQRKYNEFKTISDTSIPIYASNIRNELIRTSGIDSEYEKYIQYIQYCIEETESLNYETQKKYSWLSEILLFIIAFVQIAPMIYQFITGAFKNISIGPLISMIFIVILGIVFIIRKE